MAWKISGLGKLFFAALAAGVVRDVVMPMRLKARPDQIRAMTDAIVASKQFQAEISRPGATVDTVIQKMNLKNISAAEFSKITGKPWPLG